MKPLTEKHLGVLRRHMVELIGIHMDLTSEEIGRTRLDDRVERAFLDVPRHRFVPEEIAALAYHDTPLPIGFDKTISQPFIGALMIDLLAPEADDVVLEVGTGLGYQSAVLAELAAQVWSVEVVEEFVAAARTRLDALAIGNVELRVGDGSRGWAEHAPFDKILVSAAARQPPQALIDQLKPGGRMVLPLGPADAQLLTVMEKSGSGEVTARKILPVRFTQLEIA
ncbi:MAG TPA: protein-L-isoaspartate(D-aspartate) O-methyltransferase [Mesorhizobium sp.]|jgi:protein-L-isoaspartate(D-aspartate) O-methyltransferase|nr:protein-L-isoaspartate(D-aspartate) O-methyltransferase [Mesorhizobium sp.]